MNPASRDFLLTHSAHDYATVLLRWRAVAQKAGLKVTTFATIGEHEIIAIESRHRPTAGKGIYLSAGIHGDEPAGVWGLLAWAEANIDCLAHRPCLIFPCFNPWGLLHNNRLNEQGEDLNRRFQDTENLLVTAWLQFVGKARFQIALCLHEDYDARGIYLYELGRRGHEMGEPCLQACEALIPRDPNSEIEGRRTRAALIQRKSGVAQIAKQLDGLPEAIHLYIHHAQARKELRTWRAWACWRMSCLIFPDYPADEVQIQEEGVVEPTPEEIAAHLERLGLPGEVEIWRRALELE